MKDLFYTVNLSDMNGEWYRLHLTTTHHCLGGCGDYHSLLHTIERLVKRYKRPQSLVRAVIKTCGELPEKTYEKYVEDYENHCDLSDEVETTVNKSLQKVKESNPLLRSLKRLNKNSGESLTTKVIHTIGRGEATEKISVTDPLPQPPVKVRTQRILLRKH
jgi:hypothetical protein